MFYALTAAWNRRNQSKYDVIARRYNHSTQRGIVEQYHSTENIPIKLQNINENTFTNISFKLLPPPTFNFTLTRFTQSEIIPNIILNDYQTIIADLDDYCQIFADASKISSGTAADFTTSDTNSLFKISDTCSVFYSRTVSN